MVREYKVSDVRCKIKQLEICCAVNLDPALRSTSLNGKKALKSQNQTFQCLEKILSRTSRSTIHKVPEVLAMVRCSLVLVQAYVAHFKIFRSLFEKHFKKQLYADAEKHFSSLMSMLIPEMLENVVDTIMSFLRNEQLWKVECTCCEIFFSLLSCQATPEILLHNMLDYIEEMVAIDNVEESRHVVRVLHSIISDDHFTLMPASGIIRMLKLYQVHVLMEGNKLYLLRAGLEVVLIKLLHAVNISEIVKLFPLFLEFTFETPFVQIEYKDFGLTLMDGIARLRTNRIAENLKPKFLEFLLERMTSSCDVKSFLAVRILATIIDRPNNIDRFSTPMIFHEYTNYKIKVESMLDDEAKRMFVEYRSLFETSIIGFIKTHSLKRDNLSIVYSLLCIIIASVPCGFIVIFVVCILMNLQEYLIAERQNLNQAQTNHLHALIASVMSFICWVSRAKSLTKYVYEVVNLRYDDAPHLNPPIKHAYKYAELHKHHKKELFFDSWELRYCLWKRFRLDEELLPEIINPVEHQRTVSNEKKSGIFKFFRKKPRDKVYRIELISAHPRYSLNEQ